MTMTMTAAEAWVRGWHRCREELERAVVGALERQIDSVIRQSAFPTTGVEVVGLQEARDVVRAALRDLPEPPAPAEDRM